MWHLHGALCELLHCTPLWTFHYYCSDTLVSQQFTSVQQESVTSSQQFTSVAQDTAGFLTGECGHSFCRDCWQDYVTEKVNWAHYTTSTT